MDVVKSAFEVEIVKIDKPEIIKKYEQRGFRISTVKVEDGSKQKWAIKKRPIMRVTDLTYENIRHISAAKLVEVLDRNFGGGWDSLAQSIQDIILSGFDISTTTLPKDRLHKAGGMYEKKVEDGFEVLEIPKGTWMEAIFAKEKPEIEKPRYKSELEEEREVKTQEGNEEEEDMEEEDVPIKDTYNEEEEDDTFDDDKLTEESYRTTYETDPEDLSLEAEDVTEEDDEY